MADTTLNYARIKLPRNKNDSVPQSVTSKGVTIRQGGAGTEIDDPATIARFKLILGEKLEISKKPFTVEAGTGSIEPGKTH
jgi:hypothetical protein